MHQGNLVLSEHTRSLEDPIIVKNNNSDHSAVTSKEVSSVSHSYGTIKLVYIFIIAQ